LSDKPQALVHYRTLLPRHPYLPRRGKAVTHVSGTICHLCLGPLTLRTQRLTRRAGVMHCNTHASGVHAIALELDRARAGAPSPTAIGARAGTGYSRLGGEDGEGTNGRLKLHPPSTHRSEDRSIERLGREEHGTPGGGVSGRMAEFPRHGIRCFGWPRSRYTPFTAAAELPDISPRAVGRDPPQVSYLNAKAASPVDNR